MSISIGEVLVVLVVAILCIKPENLPATALILDKWLKWLHQTTNRIRQQIGKPRIDTANDSHSTLPQPMRAVLPQAICRIDEKSHD